MKIRQKVGPVVGSAAMIGQWGQQQDHLGVRWGRAGEGGRKRPQAGGRDRNGRCSGKAS